MATYYFKAFNLAIWYNQRLFDDFVFRMNMLIIKNEYPQSSKLAKFTLSGQSLV